MMGRIMAVDPGAKRLGIAISDPYRILATPLAVIKHKNMAADCEVIIGLCTQHGISLLLVGQALSGEGEDTPQSRHSKKLAEKLGSMTAIPVIVWDESGSTVMARKAALDMGMKRKKRTGHMDDFAAAVILQSYLDAQTEGSLDEQET